MRDRGRPNTVSRPANPKARPGPRSPIAVEKRVGSKVVERDRLGHLIRQVGRLYRKAHLTPEEWKYVNRRMRQGLGLRSRPAHTKRLPEILTPEELGQMLHHAYHQRSVYGLIVRTLFETGVRVNELVHVEVPDVDFSERTITQNDSALRPALPCPGPPGI